MYVFLFLSHQSTNTFKVDRAKEVDLLNLREREVLSSNLNILGIRYKMSDLLEQPQFLILHILALRTR